MKGNVLKNIMKQRLKFTSKKINDTKIIYDIKLL